MAEVVRHDLTDPPLHHTGTSMEGPSFKRGVIIFSPLAVILLGHVAARVAVTFLNEWAWVPLVLIYWGALGALIFWGREPGSFHRWIGPARGGRPWTILAIVIGLVPLPILLLNFHLLATPTLFVLWLLFALINPWFEEGYWRGLLLDATQTWPKWASILYSTILFTVSHPLLAGVFSVANRDWMAIMAILLMGSVWAVAYHRTGTLRWVVLAHILVDLGNLAVPVFLNLYIPPHLQ